MTKKIFVEMGSKLIGLCGSDYCVLRSINQ